MMPEMNIKLEIWLISVTYLLIYLPISNLTCQPFCNIPSDWINQAKNICYGAKNDDYAEIQIKQDCRLVAIRMSHVSGLLSCTSKYARTRWGCPDKGLSSYIVNASSSSIFAPESLVDYHHAWYSIPGFGVDDDVIILKRNANLKVGDKFHVYYGEDWFDNNESDNEGRHCIDVDASCLV